MVVGECLDAFVGAVWVDVRLIVSIADEYFIPE